MAVGVAAGHRFDLLHGGTVSHKEPLQVDNATTGSPVCRDSPE
jgi:hypothetical protein